MHGWAGWIAGAALLAFGGALLAPIAGAQNDGATPPANLGPAENGVVECLVEPRPTGQLVALLGVAGTDAPPAPPPAPPIAPPAGEPADPAAAAAVEAVLREIAVCLEQGEFARAYARYTDAFLRRTVGPLSDEELAVLEGVAFPNAGERTPPALEVLEVRRLGDGRVFLLARVAPTEGEADRLRGFTFVEEAGGWRLDDAADVADLGTPEP